MKIIVKLIILGLSILSVSVNAELTRVACVGDSITAGSRIENPRENSYPAQLQKHLGDTYAVRNFGVSGSTLLKKGDKPYWEQKKYKAALGFNPEIVVIKLGTNDSKSKNWIHEADYVGDYIELIKRFQNLESKPTVLICYSAPAYSSAHGISGNVIENEIKPKVVEIAQNAGVEIVDLFTALSGSPDLFPDGIHPNVEGAGIIAETVAKQILDN
ncbi:MAG: GDSL-type esterase/lipase family protein [Opitutales bacterium]